MTTTTETVATDGAVIQGRIRDRREALGLTRADLARAARCSLTTVQNFECGLIPRRGVVLARVERVLGDLEAHA